MKFELPPRLPAKPTPPPKKQATEHEDTAAAEPIPLQPASAGIDRVSPRAPAKSPRLAKSLGPPQPLAVPVAKARADRPPAQAPPLPAVVQPSPKAPRPTPQRKPPLDYMTIAVGVLVASAIGMFIYLMHAPSPKNVPVTSREEPLVSDTRPSIETAQQASSPASPTPDASDAPVLPPTTAMVIPSASPALSVPGRSYRQAEQGLSPNGTSTTEVSPPMPVQTIPSANETPAQSRGDTYEILNHFVQAFLDAIAQSDIDRIISFFAPTVDFLDKKTVDVRVIRSQYEELFRRWPHSYWSLLDRVQVRDNGQDTKRVYFTINYTATDPVTQRSVGGIAAESWDLRYNRFLNRYLIVRFKEDSKVTSRTNTRVPPKNDPGANDEILFRESMPASQHVSTAVLIYTPKLVYPRDSAKFGAKKTDGRYRIRFGQDGKATAVFITQSTGNSILDGIAKQGLLKWRARPGEVSEITVPVTYAP